MDCSEQCSMRIENFDRVHVYMRPSLDGLSRAGQLLEEHGRLQMDRERMTKVCDRNTG